MGVALEPGPSARKEVPDNSPQEASQLPARFTLPGTMEVSSTGSDTQQGLPKEPAGEGLRRTRAGVRESWTPSMPIGP